MKIASAKGGTLYRGVAMLVILAVLAGCKPKTGATPDGTGTPTSDVLSGKVTITIQDYEFHPDHLKVKAGTTISWINRDPVFHTVVSDTGFFQNTLLAGGAMFF